MDTHNNKCLYLTFQYVSDGDGVSKKVFAQKRAFIELGLNTSIIYPKLSNNEITYYYEENLFYTINLSNYNKGYGVLYSKIFNFIKESNITILYIRYCVNANKSFIHFLKKCKTETGCKILLEIPTYPYDKEFEFSSIRQVYRIYREKLYRKKLKYYIDRIITFSTDEVIYNIPTINISNAVDYRNIPLNNKSSIDKRINLIAVANIAFWHGLDRIIEGFYNYYNASHSYIITLTIVGNGDAKLIFELKEQVKQLNLTSYITFTGGKDGDDLNELFKEKHMAIGCLGCHRKGINEVKSLKNVEYAMRGLPFIYSENNNDFDDKKYVFKVPADETPIDIGKVCEFIINNDFEPEDLRNSVMHLTWDKQMYKIIQSI